MVTALSSHSVAVKKMKRKFFFWEECMNLREVKSLRKLNHPNIIKLKEIVRENNELFFIFEHMAHVCWLVCLLGDEVNVTLTSYVLIAIFVQRYRAPEVLFQSSSYTPAIVLDSRGLMSNHEILADMWAVGAILAELFTLCPIFPGESESYLFSIGQHLSDVNVLKILPANLSDIIPNASLEATDLIMVATLFMGPTREANCRASTQTSIFHVGKWVPHPLPDPFQMKQNDTAKPNLELNLWDFGREPDDCFLGLTLAVKPSVSNLGNTLFLWYFCSFMIASPEFEELFLAEMVHKVSQGTGEDILFCSGFQDSSGKSVFWSVLSPDRNGIDTSVDASLSLSFSSIPHPQLELESQQLDSPSSAVHCWPCPHSFNRVEYFC
ncbi:Serine/threonine-protein kinase MHK [Vitis vinifera]|uniref:Serine/threonine-protein kinase MHK n=1 Tax=Vitis vinifera TaxID=29760 RepID=A0A438DFX0_VITVI|nr:Serine/threonine-protein kinase MHK [Vitis vinifera]